MLLGGRECHVRDKDKNQLHDLLNKMSIASTPESEVRFKRAVESMGKEMKIISGSTPWHKDDPFSLGHYDFPDYVTFEQAVKMREPKICPLCEAGHVPTEWPRNRSDEIIRDLTEHFKSKIMIVGAGDTFKRNGLLEAIRKSDNIEVQIIDEILPEKTITVLANYFPTLPEVTDLFKEPIPSGKSRNFKNRPSIPSKKRRFGK